MRLIQGNRVFAEWWNTWMSRLYSDNITTSAGVKYQAIPEGEYWLEKEESNSPQELGHRELL